jgi:hypothetical protein
MTDMTANLIQDYDYVQHWLLIDGFPFNPMVMEEHQIAGPEVLMGNTQRRQLTTCSLRAALPLPSL